MRKVIFDLDRLRGEKIKASDLPKINNLYKTYILEKKNLQDLKDHIVNGGLLYVNGGASVVYLLTTEEIEMIVKRVENDIKKIGDQLNEYGLEID